MAESNIPRLTPVDGQTASYKFDRYKILSGEIPTFWGPTQDLYNEDFEYQPPPGDWPAAGTPLKMPSVARFFYEKVALDRYVYFAYGYAGTYLLGPHQQHYDDDIYNLVFTAERYQAHTHTVQTVSVGRFSFKRTLTRTISNPAFSGFGRYESWILGNITIPQPLRPFLLKKMDQTYGLIRGRYNSFTYSPFVSIGGEFPGTTWTDDLTAEHGTSEPRETGLFVVDGQLYGNGIPNEQKNYDVPSSFTEPSEEPYGVQSDEIDKLLEIIGTTYRETYVPNETSLRSFDISDVRSDGKPYEFLKHVAPSSDFFCGGKVVNFVLMARWHDVPPLDHPLVTRIRANYKYFKRYRVVILLDMNHLNTMLAYSQSNGASDATELINTFLTEIRALVEYLSEYGWSIEEIDFTNNGATLATIQTHIDELNRESDDSPSED